MNDSLANPGIPSGAAGPIADRPASVADLRRLERQLDDLTRIVLRILEKREGGH